MSWKGSSLIAMAAGSSLCREDAEAKTVGTIEAAQADAVPQQPPCPLGQGQSGHRVVWAPAWLEPMKQACAGNTHATMKTASMLAARKRLCFRNIEFMGA